MPSSRACWASRRSVSVDQRSDVAEQRAVGRAARRTRRRRSSGTAGRRGGADTRSGTSGRAPAAFRYAAEAGRAIGGMQQLRPAVAQGPVERPPGEAERLPVEERELPARVGCPHADRRLVGQRAEPLLGLAERCVRLSPGQGVAEDLGQHVQLGDEVWRPLALAGRRGAAQGPDHRAAHHQRHGRQRAGADGQEARPVDARVRRQVVEPHEDHRVPPAKALDGPGVRVGRRGGRRRNSGAPATVGEQDEPPVGAHLGQRHPVHAHEFEGLSERRLDLRAHVAGRSRPKVARRSARRRSKRSRSSRRR